MKLALLNPPHPSGATFQKEIHRCGDRVHAGELWPPTGLATLASIARGAGWDAALVDGMLRPRDPDDFDARVRQARPDVLAVLTSMPTVKSDLARCARLGAELRAPVVALGTHVTARPEEALALGADAVLVGEPDATLAEALPLGAEVRAWGRVVGVALPGHPSPARGWMDDLAALPTAARDLLENERYTMPFTAGAPFGTVQVARGCPYACSFCRTPAFSGRATRLRPIGAVLDELRDLRARGVAHAALLSDTFTMNRAWVERLCDALEASRLGVRWYCTTRVDLVDRALCERMARAGCQAVAFGIESASPETLSRVGKDLRDGPATARRAVEDARSAGLVTLGYFMLGLPWETGADLAATARFARALPLDHAFFHVATPYPGTPLFDHCLARGYLTTTDWSRYEESSLPVITTERLLPEAVLAARWVAQAAFYADPRRLYRELARTRDTADLWHKLKAGAALLRPGS